MGSRLGEGFGIFKGGSGGGGGGTVTSLTTTGTSGASTLIGGVLNIPIYGGGNGIYGGSGILPSKVNVTMGGNDIELQGTGNFYSSHEDASWGLGATPTTTFQMYQVATTHSTAHYIIQQKADVSSNVIAQRILSNTTKTGSATLYGINTVLSGTHALGTHVGMHISVTNALNNYGLIVQNGSVGIGTTTPTEILDVVGNVKITGGIDVDSSTFLVDTITHAWSLGRLATPDTTIPDAVTIGYQANTLGSGRSIAIGRTASAVATGVASNIAIGYQAKAPSGDNVISIGDQSGSTITSNGNQTILMGFLAGNQTATIGTGTIAIGDQTDASGTQATIIGSGAKGTANWAIALGRQAESLHSNGIAIGLRAETGAARAYVIASGSTGTVNSVADSLAVGFNEVAPRFLFSKTADSYLNGSGNVGIGTTTPNASALLDVSSTTKGFLPPVMTTTEMNAIGSPASGLMVFDRVTSQWMGYDGSNWVIIG